MFPIPLPVDVTNFPATQPVSAASLPLPAGASTAALQLPNNHDVTVSNFPATQPVSAAALPLPAGAATSAQQLPNNHDVTVSNFPAIYTVAGNHNNGSVETLSLDGLGHLEVAVHNPIGAFGDIKVTTDNPLIQIDAIYGINTKQVVASTVAPGTATASGGSFICSTGGLGFGALQSRVRARYRAGQGIVARFTARFPAPLPSSILVAGIGHAEDGFYVGYNGSSLGILHSRGGLRTLQEITITAGATVAGNITLNGQAYAVTNSASILRTAYELQQGMLAVPLTNYGFPSLITSGGTTRLQFVSNSAVNLAAITFAAGATNATATVAITRAGAAAVDTWVPQASWNGDRLDGTGTSGVLIDPTKFQVWQIDIQYLGAGGVTFSCEVDVPGNNKTFEVVHEFRFPNTLTSSSLRIPSFPITFAAYSTGAVAATSVESCSAAVFLQGPHIETGNRGCEWGSKAGYAATTYIPFFTLQNPKVFAGQVNQCEIVLESCYFAVDHNNPVIFVILYNATLSGNVSFVPYDLSTMLAYIDTAATGASVAARNQVVFAGMTGPGGQGYANFTNGNGITMQPGETLTFASYSLSGAVAFGAMSVVWREDV